MVAQTNPTFRTWSEVAEYVIGVHGDEPPQEGDIRTTGDGSLITIVPVLEEREEHGWWISAFPDWVYRVSPGNHSVDVPFLRHLARTLDQGEKPVFYYLRLPEGSRYQTSELRTASSFAQFLPQFGDPVVFLLVLYATLKEVERTRIDDPAIPPRTTQFPKGYLR